VFAVWQTLVGLPLTPKVQNPIPGHRGWLLGALAVGAGSWIIRFWFPLEREVAGMTLGFFSSYIFLYILGCIAWRHRWLERIERQHAMSWALVTLVTIPVLPTVFFVRWTIFRGCQQTLDWGLVGGRGLRLVGAFRCLGNNQYTSVAGSCTH
jgi:hypothetical protein